MFNRSESDDGILNDPPTASTLELLILAIELRCARTVRSGDCSITGGSSVAWFFITDWYIVSATLKTLDAISLTCRNENRGIDTFTFNHVWGMIFVDVRDKTTQYEFKGSK